MLRTKRDGLDGLIVWTRSKRIRAALVEAGRRQRQEVTEPNVRTVRIQLVRNSAYDVLLEASSILLEEAEHTPWPECGGVYLAYQHVRRTAMEYER